MLPLAVEITAYVAAYLFACWPAFCLGQWLCIRAFKIVDEFDLDVIDPPKVTPLPDGPEGGVMIDYSAQKYSELACGDIEEIREDLLNRIFDVTEFLALRQWACVQALYATEQLTDSETDRDEEFLRAERLTVLWLVAKRAPAWPIGFVGMLMIYVGAWGFVRQVRAGKA